MSTSTFRWNPSIPMHYAFQAAEAVSCAGQQGKLWEMHDRLFANQNSLTTLQLKSHAAALGVDGAKFDACLQSGQFAVANP